MALQSCGGVERRVCGLEKTGYARPLAWEWKVADIADRSRIAGAVMAGEPQEAAAGWNSPAGKVRASGNTTGSR